MITAYAAYQAKQAKTAQPRSKRPTNDPEVSLEWAQKTAEKIAGIDISGWTEEQQREFRAALVSIRDAIEAWLNPPQHYPT